MPRTPERKALTTTSRAVELTQKDDGYLRVREVKTAGSGETSFVVLARVEQDDVRTRGE